MSIAGKFTACALAASLAGAAFGADLPPILSFGGVSYLSGGIGLDESAAIKAAEKDFSLSLVFAQTRRGEFLSDVKVGITDISGKTVLSAVADGPMLLARLPEGDYTISAEYGGSVQSKSVHSGAKGVTRLSFVWQPKAKATIE